MSTLSHAERDVRNYEGSQAVTVTYQLLVDKVIQSLRFNACICFKWMWVEVESHGGGG